MQGAAPVPRCGPPPRGLPLVLPDHSSVCGTDRWQLRRAGAPVLRHLLPRAWPVPGGPGKKLRRNWPSTLRPTPEEEGPLRGTEVPAATTDPVEESVPRGHLFHA